MTRAGYSEHQIIPGVSRSKWLSPRSRSRDNGRELNSHAAQGREVRAGSWEEGGQARASQGRRGVLPGSCW